MNLPSFSAGSREGLIPKSSAEREIREHLCAFLAAELPGHRIMHELQIGGCRADVVAVGEDEILAFEIKSERDSLDRLAAQMRHFETSCHGAVVIAHSRHFDRTPYLNGAERFVFSDQYPVVWSYPKQERFPIYAWRFPPYWRRYRQPPNPYYLLDICWRDELIAEARNAGLKFQSKATRRDLMVAMVADMTGRQIVAAVCRQLRNRDGGDA